MQESDHYSQDSFFFSAKKKSCECDITWVIIYKLIILWKCFWKFLTSEDVFGLINFQMDGMEHSSNK